MKRTNDSRAAPARVYVRTVPVTVGVGADGDAQAEVAARGLLQSPGSRHLHTARRAAGCRPSGAGAAPAPIRYAPHGISACLGLAREDHRQHRRDDDDLDAPAAYAHMRAAYRSRRRRSSPSSPSLGLPFLHAVVPALPVVATGHHADVTP